jgi:hypothetical protein
VVGASTATVSRVPGPAIIIAKPHFSNSAKQVHRLRKGMTLTRTPCV